MAVAKSVANALSILKARRAEHEAAEIIAAQLRVQQKNPVVVQKAAPNESIKDDFFVKPLAAESKAKSVADIPDDIPLSSGKVADESNIFVKASGGNGKPANTLDSPNIATVSNPSKFGTYVKSALVGAGTYGVLTVAGDILSQGGNENDGKVIVPGAEGDSVSYNYYTGNAAVDESLAWLQQQIDELAAAFNELINTLFGGGATDAEGNGTVPWDFATYSDGSSGGIGAALARLLKNPLVLVGGVLVIAAAITVYRRRGSNGKKRSKRSKK